MLDQSAGHRRGEATWRSEPLTCGCRDPWTCRCRDEPPSERQLDGYQDAAQHLLDLDLLPGPNVVAMRRMWSQGGRAQRLAIRIADRWEMTA